MRSWQKENQHLDSTFLRIEGSNSSRMTRLSPQIDLYLIRVSNFWKFWNTLKLVWSKTSIGFEVDPETLSALILMFLDRGHY